ncbi:MAG: YiiX/YebB-like N1pC/P60 family cysteine hydrolase [Gammaproteobacteria bacterium]
MPHQQHIHTLLALSDAVPELIADALSEDQRASAIARGGLRPEEDDQVGYWFSRFLTLREDLWELLGEMDDEVSVPLKQITLHSDWQAFVVGFSAACLLVRLDRFLVFEFAVDGQIQRKLNEAFPEYRIGRKQFSSIFSAYSDPATMFRLYEAIRFLRRSEKYRNALSSDALVGAVVKRLPEFEGYLDISKRSYLRRLIQYLKHKWRRRGASARDQSMFAVFEAGGRMAAKVNAGSTKLVTPEVLAELAGQLQPGDILITRHRYALTNFFLPGTWPHAALYVGTPEQRIAAGIAVPPPIEHRWRDDKCTLEALRDGVLFRQLGSTLKVDAVVVIRPRATEEGIRQAIQRVVKHEGKMYNFDFDFFTSDRLVCTEVIYRAYDGVEGLQLPLVERAGRHTLSAEDILDLAIDTDMFDIVITFGYPHDKPAFAYNEDARNVVEASYRDSSGSH